MDGRRRKTVHAARRPEERPKDASHSSTFTECTSAMLTLPSFAGPTSARSVARTVRMRFSVGTGMQPRETDCVGRAWCGRGLRDRHPSTTRPTARSLPRGARAPGRHGGASTPSRSHSPRTSSARLVDRTATGATRPWRRQRATASRPLAGPRPARTLTNAPRDTSSCTADGPLISCRDRAPAAVTVAREPTAASSQPKGCAPTPTNASGANNSR